MSSKKEYLGSDYNPVGKQITPTVKSTRREINRVRKQLRKEIQIARNQQKLIEIQNQLADMRQDNRARAEGRGIYA
jgi:hypothetical protein